MIIGATAFSFIFFVFFSVKTSRNRAAAILKISALISIIITSREVIIARYDVILDKSERTHLYKLLSNYAKVLKQQFFVFNRSDVAAPWPDWTIN